MSSNQRTTEEYKQTQTWTRAQEMAPLLDELKKLEVWKPKTLGVSFHGRGTVDQNIRLREQRGHLSPGTCASIIEAIEEIFEERAAEIRFELDRLVGTRHKNI